MKRPTTFAPGKSRCNTTSSAPKLPLGSGMVESAANTVVHHRLKRPGRGWTRDQAQAMLAACVNSIVIALSMPGTTRS